MTCARREAGAHRPAPSTAAASAPPDLHPGRSRARLSRLLPVLALLFGALGLFGTAPAQAQTYWSATLTVATVPDGVGCSGSTGAPRCSSQLTDDDFTIGGTDISFFRVRDFHDPKQDRLEISFDQQIQSPPQDLKFCIGTTAYDFPDTAFREHAWNGDVGWSVGDTVSLSIDTSCSRPPAAPTGLDVTAGDGRLDLAWTAPSGAVTGYDVHYTSSTTVDDDADPSGTNPSLAWVAVSRSGTATTQALTGLTNGREYKVRVRAANAAGSSGWLRGDGTPMWAILTVTLSAAPNPVAEGASVTVTATVSEPITGGAVARIPLTVTDGTAEPGDRGTAAEIRIRRNETTGAATISTAHDADSDDETFTVAIDTDNLAPALAAGSPGSVEIEIRDDEGSSPLPPLHSLVCPASGRVWSATMTVGEGSPGSNPARYIGYVRSHPSLADMGALTRSRFAYRNGTVYGIERLYRVADTSLDANGSLVVWLDRAYTDGVAATLALHAGGKVFRFADAIQSANRRTLTWRDAGLDWLPNGQAGLCLTDTVVTLSYNDPVYEGQELRLTATVPHPLKSAVTIPVHITDALTYQETTLDDGFPGITIPANAASGTGTIFMPHDEDTVTESWRVRLGALPARLVAADPNPLYVIVYDDDEYVPPAQATLRALRNPVAEGKRVQVRLALSRALEADATIPVTVTRGTSEDGDHATLENIEVPAGDVFVYAHIGTAVDGDADDETFTVALDADNLPDGVTPGSPASVEVTIADDGTEREPRATPTVSLYVWPQTVAEGAPVRVRARLSASMWDDVTIPLTVTRATSEAGDHGTLPGITIPYGYLEAVGEIPTAVDADADDETFLVVLGALPSGVAIGPETQTVHSVTIADDGAGGQQALGAGAGELGAVAAPGYAALIARMYGWRNDPQWRHRRSHTDRWDRALLAFGEAVADASLTPMTAAEAQAWADGGLARWVEVANALRVIEAGRPYAALIAQMREWREDPQWRHRRSHTSRWDRALLAFGVPVADATLTAMTAAEAQALADGGLARWVEVAKALWRIEGGGTQAPALPVVTVAAGGAVTEGAPVRFTVNAAPATASEFAVTVTVGQEGAFVHASTLGAHTVTIPAGGTSGTLELLTVDDAADEPDGAVVATLASGAGYALGAAKRARVAVADNDEPLPGIVTKRSIAREGADEAVVFRVRLDRAAPETVTVDYATADGAGRWASTAPATAGADYTATSGTLAFAPGEISKTVSVPILDDAIDEGTEYFLLRFSRPQGATLAARYRETQGLIRNDDHLQAMWLARFGRMVGTEVTAAVSERLEAGLSPGAHATLAGQRVDLSKTGDDKALVETLTGFAQTFGAPDAPAADEDDPFAHHGLGDPWKDSATTATARSMTGRELLLGSSFHVAGTGGGSGTGLAAWGRVRYGASQSYSTQCTVVDHAVAHVSTKSRVSGRSMAVFAKTTKTPSGSRPP